MELVYTLENINDVAKTLITNVSTKTLILHGQMGVGKTTLIKALVKAIGSNDDVSSPTFSIINEYKAKDDLIYHFDLYRIKDIDEACNFGIEEYLYSNKWSIIEWPEVITDLLPERFDSIDLVFNSNDSRILRLNYEPNN